MANEARKTLAGLAVESLNKQKEKRAADYLAIVCWLLASSLAVLDSVLLLGAQLHVA